MDDAAERVRLVSEDMDDVELADRRLNYRARRVAKRVAAAPDKGFPEALGTAADLEGFYRFLANDKVTKEALLKPHADATVRRVAEHETVLIAHDNTEFRFGGEGRDGLGKVSRGGNGFHAHFCLAVAPSEMRDPLGVLAIDMWARTGESPTQRRKKGVMSHKAIRASGEVTEQHRWFRMVERSEQVVSGAASLVHLMDSESDDYVLLCNLVAAERRFILRLCYDRRLDAAATGSNPGEKALEFIARAETIATRDIALGRRGKPKSGAKNNRTQPRAERMARIAFSATKVVFARPKPVPTTVPQSVRINVVVARELHVPLGEKPVEWLLATTEPIETREQVLAVVDMYRRRWVIEEYFKALKTGCAVELRQLETSDTLFKALAIFAPVAWALLRMRTLSRLSERSPITAALSLAQIEILKKKTGIPLRKNSSVVDGYLAIARLGGHIKNNGPPGWQVIGRGFTQLLHLETGYRIAKSETSDRC